MTAHVSARVIFGNTHGLYTCLFKHDQMLPLEMSRCLANIMKCASGRDSSLNLFVLVFYSGAVSQSQVDIVRCTHLLSPVLEARSVLLEFALSQRLVVVDCNAEWDTIVSALFL